MNRELFDFIAACPTAYQAVAQIASMLEAAGFAPLAESAAWRLEPGRGYYVTRNGSSIVAFRAPAGPPVGFLLAAAHCDSPAFKIKENAELADGAYVRLATEKYGGMLCATWFDRPLSVAGRAVVRTQAGLETRLVDLGEPVALIPSVAIHMNRNANENASYNAATDMLPLSGAAGLRGRVATALGVEADALLATDLFVYNPQPGVAWGPYISAPRLDDLQCAFACTRAFLEAGPGGGVPVLCVFDNEEVGSQTKQGAASTLLRDVLARIEPDGEALRRALASSFMLSCDNAHAVHPNHPELADKSHGVYMNGGVVIKYNANQKYTSDAVSAALVQRVCERAGVPFQRYANRADMPGGSTLGNIANTQVSLNTVDIGMAQLAMHAAFETAGAEDTALFTRAVAAFYATTLQMERDGVYRLS